VPQTASLQDALRLMRDRDIGVLMVTEETRIAGIFSERDFAREAAVRSLPMNTPVSELMTREIYCVQPDQLIEECMALMTEKHIRHLPVVDDGALVGMISIGDLVRELVSEKDVAIRGLENYILGREFMT
jgi:CBS domain-containing protein